MSETQMNIFLIKSELLLWQLLYRTYTYIYHITII